MKKIVHIVGNRPQFIKLAPISRAIKEKGYEEYIIHTGQHYDRNMSDIFFQELEISMPDINLHIGSGTHGEMTGKAIISLEKHLQNLKCDYVFIYGDTDSSLAAAVVACKLQIPICHIEAGTRSFQLENPEECNRKMIDHVSQILCAPDRQSIENLKREGLGAMSYFTGDVMYDQYLYCKNKKIESATNCNAEIHDKERFVLMTWHRQENTDSKEKMQAVIQMMNEMNMPIVLPLHPRTKNKLVEFDLLNEFNAISKLHICEPLGYIEMCHLLKDCAYVVTDSGGLSKEASFAKKKCFYMVDLKIWPSLVESGWIEYIDFNKVESYPSTNADKWSVNDLDNVDDFGNGNAATKIVDLL